MSSLFILVIKYDFFGSDSKFLTKNIIIVVTTEDFNLTLTKHQIPNLLKFLYLPRHVTYLLIFLIDTSDDAADPSSVGTTSFIHFDKSLSKTS